ncbi:hypothetical protein ACHAWF_016941 [Thalassiosira exigua]
MTTRYPPRLLLMAATAAAPGALVLPAQSLQLKPSPPRHPPKSLSRTSPAWNGGGGGGRGSRQQPSTPLRAYTVADDSLFSFEGGGVRDSAATSFPPLGMVGATYTVEKDATVEKNELLSELNALTNMFDDLQSSVDYKSQLFSETIKGYESKVDRLEEKNSLLEEALQLMSATVEQQKHRLDKMAQKENAESNKEDATAEDAGVMLKVQSNVKVLEEENDMLRKRLRALEVELSDIAFESRHKPPPSPVAANTDHAVSTASSTSSVKLAPKAPSVPVPPHIYQQERIEQLQSQVAQYQRERSSVSKLFRLGVRSGMSKVGKALKLWSPGHNLLLWGELKG